MRRALPALLVACVAAIAVAGCGDSGSSDVPTKAEYKQSYRQMSDKIAALGLLVGAAVTKSEGKSSKALSKTFSDLADRTRAIADELDGKTPPDDATIKKNQAALVTGLNTAADDLEAIGKAAKKNDLKAAGTAAGKLSRDNAGVANPRRALDVAVLGGSATSAGGTPTTTDEKG